MPAKKKSKTLRTIDEALAAIIDQWYLSVSDYYVTAEKKAENPALELPEELKRFHDETGHRIKFNKGELDFTYGICVDSASDSMGLEVSVNNKVPNFNYGELVRRLSAYYSEAQKRPVEGFKKLTVSNGELFTLPADLSRSVAVEQREGKADIVRLTFGVQEKYLDELIADPSNFMELIHQHCVAPLRRIYADIYRAGRKTS